MLTAADLTPVEDPVSAVYIADRGAGTPFGREHGTEPVVREDETPFAAYRVGELYIFRVPANSAVPVSSTQEASTERPVDVKQIADREARIALLVRKFEGDGSIEDDARFQILTARMRRLEQQHDELVYDRLSNAISEIESVSENVDAIRAKLGL